MGKTQFGMTIRKLLSIARDWRRHKTVYENSEIYYTRNIAIPKGKQVPKNAEFIRRSAVSLRRIFTGIQMLFNSAFGWSISILDISQSNSQ